MRMRLSANFTLDELTNTNKSDELRAINRETALNGQETLKNLTALAQKILQPIRDFYKQPVVVSSGYRCKALNVAVGGSQTSQHSYGEAADIQIDGISVDDIFADIKSGKVVNLDNVGQVIIEKVNGAEWIHASIKTPRFIKQKAEQYKGREERQIGVKVILPNDPKALEKLLGIPAFLTTTDGKTYERV